MKDAPLLPLLKCLSVAVQRVVWDASGCRIAVRVDAAPMVSQCVCGGAVRCPTAAAWADTPTAVYSGAGLRTGPGIGLSTDSSFG